MEKRFLIKNIGKYPDIKLATGLNLKTFSRTKRYVSVYGGSGVSTEDYAGSWFLINKNGTKQKAIFKTYNSWYADTFRTNRMFNELLCEQICKQIDLPCAKYESAHIKDQDGLVSYNILGENEKLVTFAQFLKNEPTEINLIEISNAIDEYIKKGYNIDKKQAILDLYKIIVFDNITMQTDRHSYNLCMVYNKQTKTYKVAPLFDNEFAFGTKQLLDLDEGFPYTIKQFEKECSMNQYLFSIDEFTGHQYMKIHKNMQNIVKYAKKSVVFMQILKETLEKIDVATAIQNLEMQGHVVNEDYKKMVTELVEYTKEMINDELKKPSTKQEIEQLQDLY